MELDKIRREINSLDDKLAELLEERLGLAARVAEYKRARGIPILNKEREAEILGRYGGYLMRSFEGIMEVSRLYQLHLSLNKNIVLIGMMGSGKTEKGKLIASMLEIPFVDLDSEIEKKEGKITEIFASKGEAYFRACEREEAERAAKSFPSVISTGGGIVGSREAMAALRETGIVFFLNRPINSIFNDIDTLRRPMLQSPESLFSLHEKRLPLYEKYADFTIGGDTSIAEAAERIIAVLEGEGNI